MASPATENWWSSFLDAHGRDSEEEAAFDGFLTTNGIPAGADPGTLQEAYTNFRQWMEESEEREADPGPDRLGLLTAQAKVQLEQQFVAKSRVSAPGVEKPLTAVTRPKETRKPLSDAGPGPEGEANVAPASGEEPPQHPAVQATGTQPDLNAPDATPHPQPTPPEEPTPESRGGRLGRRSGGES